MLAGKREIGGYLELEQLLCSPHYQNVIALNSGRDCIEYLTRLRGIQCIWLPDYLCGSIPNRCRKIGLKVKTYSIGKNLAPNFTFNVEDGEYLLLADYYTQLTQSTIERARKFCDGRLVIDETQGFFAMNHNDADVFCSCRKYFGVSDGGLLITKDGKKLENEPERAQSHLHMRQVLGRSEAPASEFYQHSRSNELHFADEPMQAMSCITENLMGAIDYHRAREARNRNFAFLHGQLGDKNPLCLSIPDGGYMYPLLVDNAHEARANLAKQGIFIPKLWQYVSDHHPTSSDAFFLSENVLPLPVDQRYHLVDMERMLAALLNCVVFCK